MPNAKNIPRSRKVMGLGVTNFEQEGVPKVVAVSLYNDGEATLVRRAGPQAHRCSPSHFWSSGSDEDRSARRNKDKEQFPDRAMRERNGQSSLRDRSASPPRTPNWDIGADRPLDRQGAPSRNRDKARSFKDWLSRGNSTNELFPSKVSEREGNHDSKGSRHTFLGP